MNEKMSQSVNVYCSGCNSSFQKTWRQIKNKWPRCKKCKQLMVVKIYETNSSTST